MSMGDIRAALETAAMTISPAIDTVFETGEFTLASGSAYAGAYKPVAGQAYQLLHLLPAEPITYGLGAGNIERGIFQISLRYPLYAGARPASDRAALIRAKFPMNARFTSGSTTVKVMRATEIAPALVDGDRWVVPVRVRWRNR